METAVNLPSSTAQTDRLGGSALYGRLLFVMRMEDPSRDLVVAFLIDEIGGSEMRMMSEGAEVAALWVSKSSERRTRAIEVDL